MPQAEGQLPHLVRTRDSARAPGGRVSGAWAAWGAVGVGLCSPLSRWGESGAYYKARNDLFPAPCPPTLKSSRAGQGTAVHSAVPEDRIWKGREEGKNRQVPEQRLKRHHYRLHSFPPGIPHTLENLLGKHWTSPVYKKRRIGSLSSLVYKI